MKISKFAFILRLLAIAVYIASLIVIPYKTREPNMEMQGWAILLSGWSAVFNYKSILAWFANPLAFFCFFYVRRFPALCVFLSALALLLASDFDKVESLGFDSSMDVYYGEVVGFYTGIYIWLGSLILMLLASVTQLIAAHRSDMNKCSITSDV